MSNKKLDMIFSVVKTFLAILIAMVVASERNAILSGP